MRTPVPRRTAVTTITPSASYSLTVRVEIAHKPGMLGRVASAIGEAGGDIGAVDLVDTTRARVVRDITFSARDSGHGLQIVARQLAVPIGSQTRLGWEDTLKALSSLGLLARAVSAEEVAIFD